LIPTRLAVPLLGGWFFFSHLLPTAINHAFQLLAAKAGSRLIDETKIARNATSNFYVAGGLWG
jgi:hypothetical protein